VCTLIGALMLVVPQQFAAPAYTALQSHLPVWGCVFLIAGWSLISTNILGAGRRVRAVVNALSGSALIILGMGFGSAGGWAGLAVHSVLGLAMVSAAFIGKPGLPDNSQRGLLEVAAGLAAALVGASMFALPDQLRATSFDRVREALPWYAAAFLGSGVLLLASQIRTGTPHWLSVVGPLPTAATNLAYLAAVALPARSWAGMLIYGSVGAGLLVIPLIGPRLRLLGGTSLRSRLALALCVAATVPLIAAFSIYAQREEMSVANRVLLLHQTLAEGLARDIGRDIRAYEGAATAVAGMPDLLSTPVDAQTMLLRSFKTVPAAFAFATFDATGRAIARSDDRPLTDIGGSAAFEEARRTRAPSFGAVAASSAVDQPAFQIAAAVTGPDGQFAGVVVIESAQLTNTISTADAGSGARVYLADPSGQTIAQSGSTTPAVTTLSSSALLSQLLDDADGSGALTYRLRGQDWLAGYARVHDSNWTVVVERPASIALADVRTGRELLFGTLVLAAALAVVGGIIVARLLAKPLNILAAAVDRLGAGESEAPLPRSKVHEVRVLAENFARMRDRLVAGTAEADAVRRRLALLAEASAVLAESLDYEATLTSMARLLVPQLADWCVIGMVAEDGTTQLLAVEHTDPSKSAWARELIEKHPFNRSTEQGLPSVLRAGVTQLLNNPDELLEARAASPEHLRLLRQVGAKSMLIVPLSTRGKVLGGLTLVYAESGRRYGDVDVDLVEDLGRRAAAAIDNARLYRDARHAEEELRQFNEALERRVLDRTSELERRTEELRQESEALEIASHHKSEFLAKMSHDLRTPLNAIIGFSELLQDRVDVLPPEQRVQFLRHIERGGRQLLGLINDVLDLAKVEAGRMDLQLEAVSLGNLIDGCVTIVRGMASGKHITLEVQCTPPDATLIADAAKLEQILYNLLSNAVKFTPPGGRVTVVAGVDTFEAQVTVRDNGIGIRAEDQPYIFEEFRQANAGPSRSQQGSGLGLTLVRKLVELHGGTVSLQSELGQGSCFSVSLPVSGPVVAAR
jgi:signal transduction histidine kinase